MAWQEGYHTLKDPFLTDTNKKLGLIEGEISSRDAQVSFAKFCCANPAFAANLLMGVDIYPFQDIMLRAMNSRDYFLGVAGRGLGKTTIAAIFVPLYAIFNPGVTIGITSSTFRQARSIFSKIESMAYSEGGKYLRQCLVGKPSHRSDAWEMQIGQSKIVAIPLGCFGANSRVRSDRGLVKIEDYAKDEPNSWENSPLSVDTLKSRSRASHVLNAGKQKCYEVITKKGFKVTAGENHEFLAYNGEEFVWKICSQLNFQDRILLSKQRYECSQPEYNLGYDLGYKYGSEQFFSSVQEERIFSCTKEFGKGFLSGLFETGVKSFKRASGDQVWTLKLANEEIALNIQQYLLCFGIVSSRISNSIKLNYKNIRVFGKEIGDGKSHFFEKHAKKIKVRESVIAAAPKRRVKHGFGKDFFIDCVRNVTPLGERQTYDLRVPVENNYIVNGFCSHNSGDKIRGYRFNLLVIDELLLLSEKVINEVLLPFMAIQIDPRERQKVREAEIELIEAGLMKPEDRTIFPNNKLIGLTSASYEFEYLYEMYKDYSEKINDQSAKNVSHAIMQMSCEMAPVGLYDESNVENARKSYSRAQFDREYMAKFTGDSSGFYSAKKLYEISLKKGESPTVKIKGDGAKNYLLAIDPNYDASETSDDFAMTIFEVDEDNQHGYMVHGYAVASCSLSERMDYVRYIFDNFNIVYMIVDKAGGAKFVKDINDLGVLPFALDFFDAEFEVFDEEEMFKARQSYNNGGKVKRIVHSQYFSAQWIRTANESLSGAIDGKRIWFAAPTEAEGVNFDDIPIQKLKFNETEIYGNKKEDLETKRIDFIDNQSLVISKTKNQCALIEATTGATGTQRFDLPSNLQKQTGPTKTRKDSYSALVLANWGLICYFALLKTPEKKKNMFKARFLA
jgi:hypothetical protein